MNKFAQMLESVIVFLENSPRLVWFIIGFVTAKFLF